MNEITFKHPDLGETTYDFFEIGKRKYERLNEFLSIGVATVLGNPHNDLEILPLKDLSLDETSELKANIKEAMASPKTTARYKTLKEYGWLGEPANETELKKALVDIERWGLVTLGLLGEVDVLPRLIDSLYAYLQDYSPASKTYRWLEILLKYLTGFDDVYAKEDVWNLWWRQNKEAFYITSLETRLKLTDLDEWPVTLKKVSTAIDNLNTYADVHKQEPFKLQTDVKQLYNNLILYTPFLSFNRFWDFPALEQKMNLQQLISDLSGGFEAKLPNESKKISDELFGWPLSNVIVPPGLKDNVIWRNSDTFYVNKNGFHRGYLYWNNLYDHLNLWRRLSKATLDNMEWQSNSDTVNLITVWNLPYASVKQCRVSNPTYEFWTFVFQDSKLSDYEQIISSVYFLYAQLLAYWGGNRIRCNEIGINHFMMDIKIQKAAGDACVINILPKDIFEQIVCYILTSILPKYVEISEQLETKLLEEIRRVSSYVPNYSKVEEKNRTGIYVPYCDSEERKLLYYVEDALDELIWLRKNLDKVMAELNCTNAI